jgi:hypothetical protein
MQGEVIDMLEFLVLGGIVVLVLLWMAWDGVGSVRYGSGKRRR